MTTNVELERNLLKAICETNSRLGRGGEVRPAFDGLLASIIDLTESEYGFIGQILHKPSGEAYLKANAITDISWDEKTRALYQDSRSTGLEFYNLDTLFGAVITTGEFVIANDPATDPRRGGLPGGHPALRAFLGLPFLYGEELIGMVGLANRPDGYNLEVVEFLQPLATACANLFKAFRNDELRARAEDQLRESETKYRLLAENMSDVIWKADVSGRLTYLSPSIEKLSGYKPEELVGLTMPELLAGESSDFSKTLLTRTQAGEGDEATIQVQHRTREGHPVWVETSVRALRDESGRLHTVQGVTRDISDRRRADLELRRHRDHLEELVEERTAELAGALKEAEAANRAKSRFLSAMSHELRTPLNAISGFAELLHRQFYGSLNPKQLEYVEHIDKSGTHLLELITDLLDITKIDSEVIQLDMAEIDVGSLLASVRAMVENQAREKGLTLSVSAPDSGSVSGELRRCQQILVNLLSNAIKFTPEGGAIKVRAEAHDEFFLKVSVSDTGVGIDPAERQEIFSDFYQADRTRDAALGGSGIGLALTKRLVKLHGGEIGVESKLGSGSVFWFTLPKCKSPSVDAPVPDAPDARDHRVPIRRRILVVEDNEVNLKLMVDLLNVHHHDVARAKNGQEAIEQALRFRPELIFMDVHMPVMDGLDATRKLKAMKNSERIPIVALTASADPDTIRDCAAAGCDAHLPKPIQSKKLFAAIEQFVAPDVDCEPSAQSVRP